MFYLKDSQGNVVRALEFTADQITFIQRLDTKRVEATQDLSYYDQLKIKYTVLDVIDKTMLVKNKNHPIKETQGHLTLVHEADVVLANVVLPFDDGSQFNHIFKKTAQISAGVAALLFSVNVLLQRLEEKKPQMQVVQVMDRQQIEKLMITPVSETPLQKKQVMVLKKVRPVMSKLPRTIKPRQIVTQQSGVLGVLGSLKKSNQNGGLKLDLAQASAGIGRGGSKGSGGVQTSVYAKGMFASPLGTGARIQGAGGYGTRGKGGGQAGYGKVSLVGAGGSFFQPIESEAWIGGGLDRNEIAAIINRHLSEVRFCYEKGLQQKPKLAGRLSMNFMIGPNGTVTVAKVANSSLNHVPVENCIRDRLKTWNFPKPEGGVTVKVSYPFILRRVSDT